MSRWAFGNNFMFDAVFICLRVKVSDQYLWKRFQYVVKTEGVEKLKPIRIAGFASCVEESTGPLFISIRRLSGALTM